MPQDLKPIKPLPHKILNFGEAFHMCKCPMCKFLLDWTYTSDGIFTTHCCGKQYEMYCETVTIKCIGETTKPNSNSRNRRSVYQPPNSLNIKTAVKVYEEDNAKELDELFPLAGA